MSNTLLDCSHVALLAGARAVSPSVDYVNGYTHCWQDNLMNGLPLAEIANDLDHGAGQELDVKLRAAHSSAALVLNTFGPWRTDPDSLVFRGMAGFRSLRFEAKRPTGLPGTPPHLDLLAEGDLPIAIESKCTEWMTRKAATFSASYDQLLDSLDHSPWFKQIKELRAEPNRYRFLDAAQLVKHALGLLTYYGTHQVWLVYLYWEPNNGERWPECRQHRREAEDLAARVQSSTVGLIPMSYHKLWTDWERQGSPAHMQYLKNRYDREV